MDKRDSVKKQGSGLEERAELEDRSEIISHLKGDSGLSGVKSPKCPSEEDAELWQDVRVLSFRSLFCLGTSSLPGGQVA